MTTQAVFTRGSTMRHVLNMTAASATALLTMFGVDMVDMYFLTLLGEHELVAAVGFAGTLIFFLVAVSIGLQIGVGALVARSEGARNRELAARYCSSGLAVSAIAAVLLCVPAWWYLRELLALLGATGTTLDYAERYGAILLPNTPVLILGMSCAAGVRALGDARRAMYAMIAGSVVNAVLDPLFIFTFGWGLEGAAWASVLARVTVLVVAWHAVYHVHRLPRWITPAELVADLAPLFRIAGPAMLTNLATPIGGAVVLRMMSQFGDSAVAGAAIMGRVTPVAFCAIFALSGSVGPIIAQNAGAGRYDRVRSTFRDALLFNGLYVLVVWLLLALCQDLVVAAFSASDEAADLIRFYCTYLTGIFAFTGALFVANASLNNLHRAHWATGFNFGRALLGTIPAVYVGAAWYGARGVMAGEAVGGLLFGLLAVWVVFRLIGRLEEEHRALPEEHLNEAVVPERQAPV